MSAQPFADGRHCTEHILLQKYTVSKRSAPGASNLVPMINGESMT